MNRQRESGTIKEGPLVVLFPVRQRINVKATLIIQSKKVCHGILV